MQQTLLALGAHYDDCVFGIPGILVQAARKGYCVVIATLIGDYSNFAPASNRSNSFVQDCIAISREFGAEMRFLDFKSHHFEVSGATKHAVAQVVAEVRPDIAFLLWTHDRHGDHGPASRLSEVALRHAGPLLDDHTYQPPRRLYAYDNGPRHTIDFEPDTFVDVTAEWPTAMEWLERFMALAFQPDRRTNAPQPALSMKEIIAAYRGKTCGVRYAEAVRSLNAYPQDIL